MNVDDFELLSINANRFYLDKYLDSKTPFIDDKKYDELKVQYEKENPGRSVKEDLIEWDESVRRIHEPMEPLQKITVDDNEAMVQTIKDYVKNLPEGSYRINYKYDGSSIKAYYDEQGRLRKIMGTPDEEFGLDRTHSFFRLFPNRVPIGIKSIQGEVLVDTTNYGELARNKANGLTNSKHMTSEVESEAFIRAYKVNYYDGKYDIHRMVDDMKKIPCIDLKVEDKLRRVFAFAENLKFDEIPTTALVRSPNGDNIQCDGVVIYTEDCVQGFKFYYTDFKKVVITDIEWNYNSANGSFIPVAVYDPITLNDKENCRASCNGVPNMISMGIGIGAIVKVIMAKMTIPKIIEVYKKSTNFNYPKCGCGYQLSEKDIFGSVLKCQNQDVCSTRLENKLEVAKTWIKDSDKFDDIIEQDKFMPIWMLGIDRFNPVNKFKSDAGFNSEIESYFYSQLWYTEIENDEYRDKHIEEFICNGYSVEDFEELQKIRILWNTDGDKAGKLYNEFLDRQKVGDQTEVYMNEVKRLFKFGNKDDFDKLFLKWFKSSDLQYANAKINFATSLEAMRECFK